MTDEFIYLLFYFFDNDQHPINLNLMYLYI